MQRHIAPRQADLRLLRGRGPHRAAERDRHEVGSIRQVLPEISNKGLDTALHRIAAERDAMGEARATGIKIAKELE